MVNMLSNKQLVLYKLNNDNQLTQIDTVTANGNLETAYIIFKGRLNGAADE